MDSHNHAGRVLLFPVQWQDIMFWVATVKPFSLCYGRSAVVLSTCWLQPAPRPRSLVGLSSPTPRRRWQSIRLESQGRSSSAAARTHHGSRTHTAMFSVYCSDSSRLVMDVECSGVSSAAQERNLEYSAWALFLAGASIRKRNKVPLAAQ